MIGHYVHHHGSGHLHRALTLARHLPGPVTVLSSLPRPTDWQGDWVELPRDDGVAVGAGDVTAGGRLHWVPVGHAGLRDRMHLVSRWIAETGPAAMLVDQSVEVCLLARLHGVPVVGFTAPGARGDAVHRLGFDVCDALVGVWPPGLTDRMLPGVPDDVRARFTAVGACSRFGVRERPAPAAGRPRVVVMAGDGGDSFTQDTLDAAAVEVPEWTWSVLSRRRGTWRVDPTELLARADVAVVHAGQNSLAEIAALRVPAVVIPQPRPFDEQVTTARVLRDGWPAVVAEEVPHGRWRDLLEQARALDGDGWEAWCDGLAPRRVGALVRQVLETGGAR